MKERAEIVDTGIPLFYKVQIEIEAPAKKIFDWLVVGSNCSWIIDNFNTWSSPTV